VHLIVDFLVAVLFILAPFIFSFEGLDAYFYWLNGAAVLLVVSLDNSKEKDKSVSVISSN